MASFRRFCLIVSAVLVVSGVFWAGRLSGDAGAGSAEAQTVASHFQCYRIFGSNPPNVVQLTDQFSDTAVNVDRARLLCAPVKKVHLAGTPPPQPYSGDHLKCYEVRPNHPAVQNNLVMLRNQFGIEQHVKIGDAQFLCVPTEKIVETPRDCDLTINKTAFPGVPTSGTIAYQIVVNWNCPFPSPAAVQVEDNLPTVPFNPPVIIPPTPLSTMGSCSTTLNPQINCNLGTMPPNSSATIWIALDTGGNNPSIVNTAIVDPNNAISELNEGNNQDQTTNLNCC